MCRMMGVLRAPPATARALAVKFRREAREGRVGVGMKPGHTDGWGIVSGDRDGTLRYAGRSPRNASTDPDYPRAAQRVGGPLVLAHVRKASAGAVNLENTHPFLEEGYAFCHNGTVMGYAPAGESDSRAIFANILAEVRKGARPPEAIATVARDIDARCTYTSLTFLLTNGRELWGLRRVGNDPVACGPDACAPDYYTLGHHTMPDGTIVVSQEHEVLGIKDWEWKAVPDGALVHVPPSGEVTVHQVL